MAWSVLVGTVASGVGDISPAPNASHASGDLEFLIVESASGQAAVLGTAAGFAEVTSSPVDTGGAATSGATRLTCFWRRWNGSDGTPTVTDPGNHAIGIIVSVRGGVATGNPWNATPTTSTEGTTGDTSVSIPSVTTVNPDCLLLGIVTQGLPDSITNSSEFASWSNANLTSPTEQVDLSRADGNGGSIGVITGVLASAGASGATTATSTTTTFRSCLTIPITPASFNVTGATLTTTPELPAATVTSTGPTVTLGGGAWNTTTGNKTATFTPAVNDLLVVWCGNSGRTTAQPPTVTDDNSSGTYTQVGTAHTKNLSADSGWWFIRDSLISSAASTIVTMTQSGDTGGGLLAYRVTGVTLTGANARRQDGGQDNTATGTPSITMGQAILTGNPVLGVVVTGTNGSTNTAPPTGWTEDGDSGYATPDNGLERAHRASGETNTTVAWTASTASEFYSMLLELQAGQVATGATLSTTPSLPQAALQHQLPGAVITATPSLPQATLQHNVGGTALTTTPSLPTAAVTVPSITVTGVVLDTTPSLPAATLRHDLAGTVLTTTPSLPAATLQHSYAGTVLTATPSLPAAALRHELGGVTLTTTPSLPAGAAFGAVYGAVLDTTPTLPAAGLQHQLGGATLTTTPELPAGVVGNVILGEALTTVPTLPVAALQHYLTGATLSASPSLPQAALRHDVTATVLTATPSFPQGALRFDVAGRVITIVPELPAAEIQVANSPGIAVGGDTPGHRATGSISQTHTMTSSVTVQRATSAVSETNEAVGGTQEGPRSTGGVTHG